MSDDETEGRESHDEDLAYLRNADPSVKLDHMSVDWSINRLADNLVDLGKLIPKRLRERLARSRTRRVAGS
jgi:hypothetical protein